MEPESSDEGQEGCLENPGVVEEFRIHEKGIGNDTRAGCATAAVPEFPTVRRITLGMNSPLVVPSLHARATVERQQREFTNGWDPLFIRYSAVMYFHKCEIKIN